MIPDRTKESLQLDFMIGREPQASVNNPHSPAALG